MKTAPFGSTGVSISRLGMGGWQAGGTGPWGAGPQSDDDDAIAAIRRAVERGVTWIETAASVRTRSFGGGRRSGPPTVAHR